MTALIDAALGRSRTVLLILLLILIAGSIAYSTIPKESDPDVAIPILYVTMSHDGISPEDAERLLVKPMEKELRSIEGLKELRATASEGHASVTLEFEAGFDNDQALIDVRERVDIAKAELPDDTDEPAVHEVNVALFPVLVITLSGDVPERTLVHEARGLRDKIEALSGVLEVEIAGDREDLLEVIVHPERLESYGLSLDEVLATVAANNRLVAAGALDTGLGRFSVKVPGLIETMGDMLNMPLMVSDERVVRFRDIGTVRRTFKDPDGFARVNGKPALALEVSKRIGTNIIDTIDDVRRVVEEEGAHWPAGIEVGFSQDKSDDIRNMLNDLQNNVIAAVLLVMIVVIAALGVRTAGLVGVAIPGSFLTGILVLSLIGLTVNIVVLFALIMAVGMLVDGAIVVVEMADRKMAEGLPRQQAYGVAAKRMAWPIIAATATTLAAFMPLLFWPGIVGEFMKYLPITLIATLSASLAMALIFVPALGALIGRRAPDAARKSAQLAAAESGDLATIKGMSGWYLRLLRRAAGRPFTVVLIAIAVLVGSYAGYGQFGRGVEFFPDVEPENAIAIVRARGDLSVVERDNLLREVEQRILDMNEFATIYARSQVGHDGETPEDTIGTIQLEFVDWQLRRPATEILAEVRQRTSDLAGIVIEARGEEGGPSQGKPVQIQLSSRFSELLPEAVEQVLAGLEQVGGFVDVTDSRPLPGIEWQLEVDRAEATRYGVNVASLGSVVQLVTNGVMLGDYRPDDSDEDVDIRVRYPLGSRGIDQLDTLRVPSAQGAIPIANFVHRQAVPRTGNLQRSDTRRVLTIEADVAEGELVDSKVGELRNWLGAAEMDPRIEFDFKGEDEDQREAQQFLLKAFGVALFVMAIILVTQFNSFYQAFLILSAVVFSTVGVLLGLLITGQPFGIVMSGVGVIALAGIVVNNNIVLIDTYNNLRRQGMEAMEAVLRTGTQRLRPVLLTTVTTILGLMPMVLAMNIDLINRQISIGGPSTQWWTQLATAVAGGLAFATVLTLVLTPALLVLGERLRGRKRRGAAYEEAAAAPLPR